jgi:DNA-binding beta-propeller fold protein YncE
MGHAYAKTCSGLFALLVGLGVPLMTAHGQIPGSLSFVEVHKDGAGAADGLDGARSVTVSPDGAQVYAAGTNDDAVAVFARDAATGKLTFVEVQKDGVGGVDGLAGAVSVTVSPDGAQVYAAGSGDDAIAVFGIVP